MDALSVSPLSSVARAALSAYAVPKVQLKAQETTLAPQDLVQGLAQNLFRQSLQAAALAPAAESGSNIPLVDTTATASLLAALTTPQDTTTTTATASATTLPALSTTETPTAATPALPQDLAPVQDAFQTSASPDFALQTALRFGAGVAPEVALAAQPGDLSAALVRDAQAVPRLRNLQPHAGGPGPEAFAQTQGSVARVLRTYTAPPVAEPSGTLDVLV